MSSVFVANNKNKYPKATAHYDMVSDQIEVSCQCGRKIVPKANPQHTPGFVRADCPTCGRHWTAIVTIDVAHGDVI